MQKAHAINDLLLPAIGIAAIVTLSSISFQFWCENQSAFEAENNGPMRLSCAEIESRDDLASKYVEVIDAKKARAFSVCLSDEALNICAFRVIPTNQPANPAERTLFVQGGSGSTAEEAEAYWKQVELAGLLRTSDSMYFRHIDCLSQQYPEVDFKNCYVLVPGAPIGSTSLSQHLVVFFILFGMAGLGCIAWLISGIRRLVSAGITFAPETDPLVPTASTPILPKAASETQPPAPAKPEWLTENSVVPPLPPIVYTSRILWLAAASMIVLTVLAFFYQASLPLGLEALGIFLSLGLLSASFLVTAKACIHADSICRKILSKDDLPFLTRRFFDRHDSNFKRRGFRHCNFYRSNQAYRQFTSEYLSDDGMTVASISHSIFAQAVTYHTILWSGEVILTIDIPLEGLQEHPKLSIVTGIKGEFGTTFAIHRQAIEGLKDQAVPLSPTDGLMFWVYATEIELQAMGSIPYQHVPILPFSAADDELATYSIGSLNEMPTT